MKKKSQFIIVPAFALFALGACKKAQKLCCTVPLNNDVSANRNNINWNSLAPKAVVHTDSTFVFSGTALAVTDTGRISDSLTFKVKYNAVGQYTLKSSDVSYNTYITNAGGTRLLRSYPLDDTYNNTLTLTQSEMDGGQVLAGGFDVKFIDVLNANGVTFSQGRILIKLSK